jgi:AhpD family alkylhydroperoxidase
MTHVARRPLDRVHAVETAGRQVVGSGVVRSGKELPTMSVHEQVYPPATRDLAKERTRLAPRSAEAFRTFSESVFAEGALSAKTKQLIAVAVAHVTQCPYRIRGHTSAALRHGATAEEIMEAHLGRGGNACGRRLRSFGPGAGYDRARAERRRRATVRPFAHQPPTHRLRSEAACFEARRRSLHACRSLARMLKGGGEAA